MPLFNQPANNVFGRPGVLVMRAFACFLVAAVCVPSIGRATFRQCNNLFETIVIDRNQSGHVTGFRTAMTEVDGRPVYYRHFPATHGKATAIVFMGLYTPVADYIGFQKAFAAKSKGEGLIMFSYGSMPESLASRTDDHRSKNFYPAELVLNDLLREATAVINSAGVRGPVTAVGYSFGSAPASRFAAFHQGRVNNLILVAPLVVQGEHSAELMNGKAQLETMAAMNPLLGNMWLAASREHLARNSAIAVVNAHFNAKDWPANVKREDVINGIAGRIRATEDFDLRREDFSPWPRTHFLLADQENPLRVGAQTEVVKQMIAAADGRLSKIPTVTVIENSGHGVLGIKPQDSADFILRVLRSSTSLR